MQQLTEPARQIPIAFDCDLCVIGGSGTGVFAAVRAARLGLSVALVEQNIVLGGMAVAAQVNEWHRLTDANGTQPIIGGLTAEVLERLRAKAAVRSAEYEFRGEYHAFNSADLALELDALVLEHGIRCFLKCSCVAAIRDGATLSAVIIEDKSGRRAIRARQFIDASGDGDLLRRAGFAAWQEPVMQPVMYQMIGAGFQAVSRRAGGNLYAALAERATALGYPAVNARPWINPYPAPADLNNIYGPRQQGVDASDADQLSAAVLRGRRYLGALLAAARERFGADSVAPVHFAHALGVRETWHARCQLQLTGADMLAGRVYADSIGRGTYPVDVHSPEGTLLRHMDGTEEVIDLRGGRQIRRWREAASDAPMCYHIPYRALVPLGAGNLLVAGRLLDADREGYGGVRVMVNMNQTGEAAGVAAALALQSGRPVAGIDVALLRTRLADGGSLIAG